MYLHIYNTYHRCLKSRTAVSHLGSANLGPFAF